MTVKQRSAPSAKGIDVVYALGSGTQWGDNEELRYSLRALQANFSDLRQVYVVGQRPAWLGPAAIHIAADDVHRRNKDANIIEKLLLAARHPAIGPHFVRSSDDELLVRPTRFDQMRGRYHGGLHRRRLGDNLWNHRLERTQRYLFTRGYPTHFYDCHLPVPYETRTFRRIAGRAPYATGAGLAIDSLYFNMAREAPVEQLDEKVVYLTKPLESVGDLARRVQGGTYLGYSNQALNEVLQDWLREAFPTPSRYEQVG